MFVLRIKANGAYVEGRYSTTDNLQRARTFKRKCDAMNARLYQYKKDDVEAVEVVLVPVPIPIPIASALNPVVAAPELLPPALLFRGPGSEDSTT